MENLDFIRTHEFSFSLFIFLLLSFVLSSSAYSLPDNFFINCGSDSNVSAGSQTFVGDRISGDSVSFTKQGSSVETSNQSSSAMSSIYQTARIFKQPSSFYGFEITSNGIYMVRLHFSAVSSRTDLLSARFNVSASGFSLLSNFSVGNSTNKPDVEEFIMNITESSFKILFSPQRASLAFVNAIEVFPAPENFIPNEPGAVLGKVAFSGLSSKILHPIYRLNVGGPKITSESDTLRRDWSLDDDYLFLRETARNAQPYSQKLNYAPSSATNFDAPDIVYQTAKEMNISNNPRVFNDFNVTWSFGVKKNIKHFVRVHFCDILSRSVDAEFMFNLYINAGFLQEINPYSRINDLAAPFYDDFVVDSDVSGVLNISIGFSRKSDINNGFLNGLEIMEIMGKPGLVSSPGSDRIKRPFIIAGSVVGGLLLMSVLVFLVFLKRKKPKPVVETLEWSPLPGFRATSSQTRVFEEGIPLRNLNLGLKVPLADILIATNNFDENFLIGKGGFGNVYKGILPDGTKVAVKRSKPDSRQGFSEFQTEIQVLSKIRHRHLVSLIGYCDENSEMILVYDFMEKGTLKDHLYGSDLPSLSWKQRLEICIGAARGLDYLHSGSATTIIHRDVKSTNILLDANHVAKVADFGLSKYRPLDQNQDHVSTAIKGTLGYLDPEYFRSYLLTEKSDVYSFGVVLLEVLCARPAISLSLPSEQVNLAEWGMFCKDKGIIEEIMDPVLVGMVNPNSLRKFLEVLEKCLKEDGDGRPRMADVLWDLQYALQLQQTAARREPPHGDSTATGNDSSGLRWVNVRDSFSSKLETRDFSAEEEDSSSSARDVFSQIKMGGAR